MPKIERGGVIHFFYGDNDFALKRAVDELTAKFAAECGVDAVTKIDAVGGEPRQLLAEILNVSLFAPRRLLVVKDANDNGEFWRSLGDNLARLADGPNDVLLLAAAPDRRTKTFKSLLQIADVREFAPLKHFEIIKWIQTEAAAQHVQLQSDAAEELAAACGDDQWRIYNELQKLAELGRAVDKKCVREFVEPDLAANAFSVLEQALGGRTVAAAAELQKLRQLEDANKFLGLLASQVFALAAAVFSGDAAAKDLKIHPFQLAKMRDLARELGSAAEQKARVKKCVQLLAETDAKMKTSSGDDWTLIELALAKI